MKEASNTIECHVEGILMNISVSDLKGRIRHVDDYELPPSKLQSFLVVVDSGEEC